MSEHKLIYEYSRTKLQVILQLLDFFSRMIVFGFSLDYLVFGSWVPNSITDAPVSWSGLKFSQIVVGYSYNFVPLLQQPTHYRSQRLCSWAGVYLSPLEAYRPPSSLQRFMLQGGTISTFPHSTSCVVLKTGPCCQFMESNQQPEMFRQVGSLILIPDGFTCVWGVGGGERSFVFVCFELISK